MHLKLLFVSLLYFHINYFSDFHLFLLFIQTPFEFILLESTFFHIFIFCEILKLSLIPKKLIFASNLLFNFIHRVLFKTNILQIILIIMNILAKLILSLIVQTQFLLAIVLKCLSNLLLTLESHLFLTILIALILYSIITA